MKLSQALLLRVAAHAAVWVPFLTGVAGALRASWGAVGDGARIAMGSWEALTAHGPLLGPATQLGPHLFDPGPLEFWLLAVPVHLDPVRGVFWGAALWCMAAGSLAVEAMWAVRGEIGGVLAAGAILWALAWRPEIAAKPYWNPWFATMFFLAALARGLGGLVRAPLVVADTGSHRIGGRPGAPDVRARLGGTSGAGAGRGPG